VGQASRGDKRDRVRVAAVSVKESVMGSASDAAASGRQTGQSIGDAVSDGTSTVACKAKGSPIAAGLIAFGARLEPPGAAGTGCVGELPMDRAVRR
jgi:hypothetical protein